MGEGYAYPSANRSDVTLAVSNPVGGRPRSEIVGAIGEIHDPEAMFCTASRTCPAVSLVALDGT